MSVINIQSAQTSWFEGAGWYVITEYNEFLGPFLTREMAKTAEKFRSQELDPWGEFNDSQLQGD